MRSFDSRSFILLEKQNTRRGMKNHPPTAANLHPGTKRWRLTNPRLPRPVSSLVVPALAITLLSTSLSFGIFFPSLNPSSSAAGLRF